MATNANKCFSLKSNLTSIKPICSSYFETNFNREKMPQTSLTMKFSTGGPLQADVLGREDYWPNNAFWLVEFRDAHRLTYTCTLYLWGKIAWRAIKGGRFKRWVGSFGPGVQTLILFKTRFSDVLIPFKEEFNISRPYLSPKSYPV